MYRWKMRGSGPLSIIVRMSAIRKLAAEAADNGLLAPEMAAGIARMKGVKRRESTLATGCRCARHRPYERAGRSTKGIRDRAILAVLLGLRTSPF